MFLRGTNLKKRKGIGYLTSFAIRTANPNADSKNYTAQRERFINAGTSPGVGIGNHNIKNNIDQQQRHTQQDLFGGAKLFHFSISYFYVAIESTMRNSLFYNFFNIFQ